MEKTRKTPVQTPVSTQDSTFFTSKAGFLVGLIAVGMGAAAKTKRDDFEPVVREMQSLFTYETATEVALWGGLVIMLLALIKGCWNISTVGAVKISTDNTSSSNSANAELEEVQK